MFRYCFGLENVSTLQQTLWSRLFMKCRPTRNYFRWVLTQFLLISISDCIQHFWKYLNSFLFFIDVSLHAERRFRKKPSSFDIVRRSWIILRLSRNPIAKVNHIIFIFQIIKSFSDNHSMMLTFWVFCQR